MRGLRERRRRPLARLRALAAQVQLVAAQFAALLGRQRLHVGFEALGVHVEVADVAERAREPTQVGAEARDILARQQTAEEPQRDAQPSSGDAQLMDLVGRRRRSGLRLAAEQRRGLARRIA